jgi:hypothetical protein
MRVPDMVGDENNEHIGLGMMHVTKDGDTGGRSVVGTAIDQNLKGDLDRICALPKGIRDVLTLVNMNGLNDEYLKVVFESDSQTRGRILPIEVAEV